MRTSALALTDLADPRVVPEVKVYEYTFADLDAGDDFKVVIPANTIVLNVGHEVVTAFAGGTPSCDVGDAADADGYIPTANISETVAGNLYFSQGGAGAYAQGRKYSVASQIIVAHATGLTAGAGKLYIEMLPLTGTWRQPDL
jgi:hypothetical protein